MPQMILIVFMFCAMFGLSAQDRDKEAYLKDDLHFWKILSKVQYKTVIDDGKDGDIYYVPLFHKNIERYEGKTIYLKGYIIPPDLARGKMTLSMFPFSSCFFCGKAGAESVVEVLPGQPLIYRMDKPVELAGILQLNRTDPLRLMYILKDARYVD